MSLLVPMKNMGVMSGGFSPNVMESASDADKEFGSQCRLLKERGLSASFFDYEDFEKL